MHIPKNVFDRISLKMVFSGHFVRKSGVLRRKRNCLDWVMRV